MSSRARRAWAALTLRTLGGLTTPEIARAFLVPEATLARRLVRPRLAPSGGGAAMRLAYAPNGTPCVPKAARVRGGCDDRGARDMNAIFGAILPRFALLVGWANDQAYWNGLLGSPALLLLGFLVLPWTTFIYGLVQVNGLTLLNIVFLVLALLADLGTWGFGVLAARKPRGSSYR